MPDVFLSENEQRTSTNGDSKP